MGEKGVLEVHGKNSIKLPLKKRFLCDILTLYEKDLFIIIFRVRMGNTHLDGVDAYQNCNA